MTSGLRVSVVICVYTIERWQDLTAAVDSLRRQSVPPDEIIVVVDHNPELFARARENIRDVVVVANGGPQGLNTARNTGVAHATGEVIAFLDDDAIAATDWIEQLQACYGDAQVLGVGGSIEPVWADESPVWFPAEFYWVVGCTYRGLPETTAPVRNLIGCNMSFRREVFDAVGGFRIKGGIRTADLVDRRARTARTVNSEQPIACEETDLCVRAGQHWPGRVLLYNPRARVWHRVPRSRTQWRYFRSRCYYEGRSKALLSGLVGAKDALAAERRHALLTLPSGIVRQLAHVFRDRDPAGLSRAAVIMVGLAITASGYLAGTVPQRLARGREEPALNASFTDQRSPIGSFTYVPNRGQGRDAEINT